MPWVEKVKHKPAKTFTSAEIALYMSGGIEKSAQQCERDGMPEKAARLYAWAADLRRQAQEPEETEETPQGELFS